MGFPDARSALAAAGSTISSHIMPGKSLSGGRHVGHEDVLAARKLLYAVDASLTPASPVGDIAELIAVALAAVRAGGGHWP